MNGQKGNFSGAVNSWLNALPLSEKDKDAIWNTFYNADISQEDFASRVEPFLEQRGDRSDRLTQLVNWRRQLSELNQPPPSEAEAPGIGEEFLTGMGRAFMGTAGAIGKAAKEAISPIGERMPTPPEAMAKGAASLGKQLIVEPAVAMFEKAKEAPAFSSERLGYGMAAALPIAGPLAAYVAETVPEVAPDWASPSTYRAGPLARIGGEVAAGYLMGRVTPRAVKKITTEPRETMYRMMQRVRPTSAARDLSRAVKPPRRASESPEILDERAQLAIEDLKRGEALIGKTVGATRKNEAGKPIRASSADIYRDAYDASEASLRELGKYMDAYESPDVRPPVVAAAEIADDILGKRQKSILEESAIPDKEAIKAREMYQERADAVRTVPGGEWSIRQIIDEIHNVNKRLKVFEDASKSGRQVITADLDNQYNVLRAYRDSLQKARDKSLDALDSQNAKDIYRRYGNLRDWQISINDGYLKATGESLYGIGDLVSDVSFFRSMGGAIESAAVSPSRAIWQALEATAIRGAIKASKEAAAKSFDMKKAFEKAKPSTLPNLDELTTGLTEKAARRRLVEMGVEQERLARTPQLPMGRPDQLRMLEQSLGEAEAAYTQAQAKMAAAQRSENPQAMQLKRELRLEAKPPVVMSALEAELVGAKQAYESLLRQMRELQGEQPSLGRTMGTEPGTELVREYPQVAEPFLGGIPEAEVARRSGLIPEPAGAVEGRYQQQLASEQAAQQAAADLAAGQFEQRVQARSLADQAAREAERSAMLDEAMFREMAQKGRGATVGEMRGAQRAYEQEARATAKAQAGEAKMAAKASRTTELIERQRRIDEAQQARLAAEQQLAEAKAAERQAMQEARSTQAPPKEAPAPKPLTAAEQKIQAARQAREEAAAKAKATQEDVAQAKRGTAKETPSGPTLMFEGQPIKLTGRTDSGYEEFVFTKGPLEGKLGYRKISQR